MFKRPKDVPRVCQKCGKNFLARRDQVKSGGAKYCSISCSSSDTHWKGGRFVDIFGYAQVYAGGAKYKREHRDVMEKHLGRKLSEDEIIHHINGNTLDNCIENLQVMTQSEHARLHHKGKKKAKCGWSMNYHRCIDCGGTRIKHCAKGLCRTCYVNRRRYP